MHVPCAYFTPQPGYDDDSSSGHIAPKPMVMYGTQCLSQSSSHHRSHNDNSLGRSVFSMNKSERYKLHIYHKFQDTRIIISTHQHRYFQDNHAMAWAVLHSRPAGLWSLPGADTHIHMLDNVQTKVIFDKIAKNGQKYIMLHCMLEPPTPLAQAHPRQNHIIPKHLHIFHAFTYLHIVTSSYSLYVEAASSGRGPWGLGAFGFTWRGVWCHACLAPAGRGLWAIQTSAHQVLGLTITNNM